MSLNSLTFSRVAAEKAAEGGDFVAHSLDKAPEKGATDTKNALSALVEYLPSETVSLYLASIAALPALEKLSPVFGPWGLYAGFAVATPALYSLVYMGKRHAAKLPRFPGWKHWPWWPMIAASVAFLAWGLAVPQGPFVTNDSRGVVAGLFALFVSIVLGVIGEVV